jgi:hypothetical protein
MTAFILALIHCAFLAIGLAIIVQLAAIRRALKKPAQHPSPPRETRAYGGDLSRRPD